jgi:hypothetical protein
MHAQTLVRAFPFPANALCFVIDVFRRQEHGCRSVAAIALLVSALNESTKLSSTATPFARTRPRLAFSQFFFVPTAAATADFYVLFDIPSIHRLKRRVIRRWSRSTGYTDADGSCFS